MSKNNVKTRHARSHDPDQVEYLQAQITCLINRLKKIRKLCDEKNAPHRLKRIKKLTYLKDIGLWKPDRNLLNEIRKN